MKNILTLQNKISPEDFAPLDADYFKEESLDTEEIGYWKASWIRLKCCRRQPIMMKFTPI